MSSPERAAAAAAPGPRERLALLAVAALLTVLVLWLRGGLQPEAPLEALARRSPELPAALADGRPTLVEFYADWCEACRAMAQAMAAIERERRGDLDVVLLNVDNPRWQPELERYAVNGIPHLELFDAGGGNVGRAIGARSAAELEAITAALVSGDPLPRLAGVGAVSRLDGAGTAAAADSAAKATAIAPRSHG
jgi:thiol:disulfide interchange protein